MIWAVFAASDCVTIWTGRRARVRYSHFRRTGVLFMLKVQVASCDELCGQVAVIDQRCALIAIRRGTGGPLPKYNAALRERWETLTRVSLGTIYTLIETAIILDKRRSKYMTMSLESTIKEAKQMGAKQKNAPIFNKARKLIREVFDWKDLGPVKVNY